MLSRNCVKCVDGASRYSFPWRSRVRWRWVAAAFSCLALAMVTLASHAPLGEFEAETDVGGRTSARGFGNLRCGTR
jgi:hypothetical protein